MDVCIANIGLRQRRRRAGLGVAALAAAVVVAAAPSVMGLPSVLRFLSLPLFYGAALGVLQHREKT